MGNNCRGGIAFHEAGHAVASRFLGRPVALVTIEPMGDRLGNMWAKMPPPSAAASNVKQDLSKAASLCRAARALMLPFKSREPGAQFVLEALDKGVVLLSGPEAERRATGDCFAGSADLLEARMLASALAISSTSEPQYFRLFELEARTLVARLWREITAVAEALIRQPNLTGEDLDSVIARWRSPAHGLSLCAQHVA